MDMTLVSNCFIDHYMKDANDAQIKIYLYILRMVSANLPTDITEIADRFNQTEKEVLRCLRYWEQLQIMELDYDKAHNLTGIHFLDNPPVQNALPEAPVAPVATVLPEAPVAPAATALPTVPEVPAASVSCGSNERKGTKMMTMTMDYEKEKASYSISDIQKISNDPNTKMLIMVAEQYFGRALSPDEIKSLLFIYDRLAFHFDLIDYLLMVELNL